MIGDVNDDGAFDSSDLVAVFQSVRSDLVFAFQAGSYVRHAGPDSQFNVAGRIHSVVEKDHPQVRTLQRFCLPLDCEFELLLDKRNC